MKLSCNTSTNNSIMHSSADYGSWFSPKMLSLSSSLGLMGVGSSSHRKLTAPEEGHLFEEVLLRLFALF